jgi:hypothetical protein
MTLLWSICVLLNGKCSLDSCSTIPWTVSVCSPGMAAAAIHFLLIHAAHSPALNILLLSLRASVSMWRVCFFEPNVFIYGHVEQIKWRCSLYSRSLKMSQGIRDEWRLLLYGRLQWLFAKFVTRSAGDLITLWFPISAILCVEWMLHGC